MVSVIKVVADVFSPIYYHFKKEPRVWGAVEKKILLDKSKSHKTLIILFTGLLINQSINSQVQGNLKWSGVCGEGLVGLVRLLGMTYLQTPVT